MALHRPTGLMSCSPVSTTSEQGRPRTYRLRQSKPPSQFYLSTKPPQKTPPKTKTGSLGHWPNANSSPPAPGDCRFSTRQLAPLPSPLPLWTRFTETPARRAAPLSDQSRAAPGFLSVSLKSSNQEPVPPSTLPRSCPTAPTACCTESLPPTALMALGWGARAGNPQP